MGHRVFVENRLLRGLWIVSCLLFVQTFALNMAAMASDPGAAFPTYSETAAEQQQYTSPKLPSPPVVEEKKRHWWQVFKKKQEEPPVKEEDIVNVGPRDYPATEEPLMRISAPIRNPGSGAIVTPGFYIAKLTKVDDERFDVRLFQKNVFCFSATLSKVKEDPDGPVEPVNPDKPAVIHSRITSVLSADHQSLMIVMELGRKRYESPPIPTALDARENLSF